MKHIAVIGTSRSGHNWTTKVIRSWMNGDIVMQFENTLPKTWNDRKRHRLFKGQLPPEDSRAIGIIQIRDYLNCAASWINYLIARGNAYKEGPIVKVFDVWLEIAKEGFNDTSFVDDKVLLFYDRFATEEAYRRSVCNILGGVYNESQIDHVPKGGMGSSFDKMKLQGSGSQMEVTKRWKWFLTEEGSYYIRYLKCRPQIAEYYAEKFELIDGQRNLVDEILN